MYNGLFPYLGLLFDIWFSRLSTGAKVLFYLGLLMVVFVMIDFIEKLRNENGFIRRLWNIKIRPLIESAIVIIVVVVVGPFMFIWCAGRVWWERRRKTK